MRSFVLFFSLARLQFIIRGHIVRGHNSLLLRRQEDKVTLRVCTQHVFFISSPTDGCMYLCYWEDRTRSLCVCTQHIFFIPSPTDGRMHLCYWKDRRTRLLCVCVCVCVYTPCLPYPFTHWWCACICYWEDRTRSLCVCVHILYPFTHWRPVRWKRCMGQDTAKGCRAPHCLQAGQPLCTLPQSPCGHQSWTPDENFEDLLL